nr:MAG TPA: Serine-rich adhesin [Caudoviricetes sp.]
MNFTGINLDLQGVIKRTYENLLYQSTFTNFLNRAFMEVARQTGTPMIEVIKQLDTPLNVRNSVEITNPLTSTLATYDSVKVDLTQLPMDYSFRISPLMIGSNIENALEGQINLKDSQVAYEIDKFGYNKFASTIIGASDGSMAYTNGQVFVWAPATKEDYITNLNLLSSMLYDRKINGDYLLGLSSTEYANYVSALTSILKFETRAGVEGVDTGKVAEAYGVSAFQINSNVLKDNSGNATALGYFAHEIGTVGDMFFSSMAQYLGNYPTLPGYYVIEGNILFGADVVRPEAVIRLVASAPSVTAGTFDAGTVGASYSQTTAFSGTNVASFEAVGLPAGLSINESTGAVTGTPTTAGTYEVSIYGVDANGIYSNAKKGTITIASA